MRVAVRVVKNLQIEAARTAAGLLSGGQDAFGEEHVLLDTRRFALALGEYEKMVDRVLKNLTCSNASSPARRSRASTSKTTRSGRPLGGAEPPF